MRIIRSCRGTPHATPPASSKVTLLWIVWKSKRECVFVQFWLDYLISQIAVAICKGICNGLYVGSVLHDPDYTNGEYWLYIEAPINMNDEGPMALWTSKKPAGPFSFKAYILD